MASAPGTTIRLCGRFVFEAAGEDLADSVPSGQARTLLLYLLANRHRTPDRDELIDVVWPETPPKNPQNDLRPILSRLRRALGPVSLDGRERLRLELPEPVSVDIERAEAAVAEAREAAAGEEWARAQQEAREASVLLAAEFLPGHSEDWAEQRRRELAEIELEALELSARSGLELGGTGLGEAERAAKELIERSPYRESAYRILMEALAGAGNQAEALATYERLRTVLRDELGTTPGREVQQLHGRLLSEEGAGGGGEPIDESPPAAAPPRAPLPALLSPRERGAFVGRAVELEVLTSAWSRAQAGERQAVFLAGEPGIGKTRLSAEFAVQAHADGTVLYAACPQEPLLPYQPLVEAMRSYADARPLGELGDLGPGAAELAALVPALGAAAPGAAPSEDPETRRFLMFEAVVSLFTRASAETPIVLVIDDLHWADPPTLRLLRHLLTAPAPASLLVLGTYRSGQTRTGDPLSELIADLRRAPGFERIELGGLGEGEVKGLVSFYAGAEAPEPLLRSLHTGTDGNPFFLEELMRNLIESGALFEREGRWVAALDAGELGVPEGVREVLLSRLSRLSEETLTVIGNGAVLGREFPFDLLGAMSQIDEEALLAAIEEGLGAQLLVEQTRGGGIPRYAFTHALVRETLLDRIANARLQRMHAEAARAIEEAGPADDDLRVAALAHHLRLAGTAGDPAKAVEFSLRAGTHARAMLAWDDAAAHLDGAVDVLERTGEQPELLAEVLTRLAELMVVVGNVGRQLDYLDRALELREQLGQRPEAARVHSRLGMGYTLMDSIYAEYMDVGTAFEHFAAAEEVLGPGSTGAARGHLLTAIATGNTYAFRIDRGIAAAEEAMALAEEQDDVLLWIGAAEANSWHQFAAGNLERAFSTLERAFDAASERRRPFLAWTAANMCGQHAWGIGDPDRAQRFFEKAALPQIERTAYRQIIADGLGRCCLARGEVEEARRLLPDAKPVWLTHALRPVLALWEGEWEQAEALAREVLEISARTGNRWDEWAAHHLRGRALAMRGDHAGAAEPLGRALEIVVEGRAPQFELWVRPDLARSLAAVGQAEAAAAEVDRCRKILGNGESWPGLAAEVELADAVARAAAGALAEADSRFAAALAGFDEWSLRTREAAAHLEWGRALSAAGEERAGEQLTRASELLARYGAGAALQEQASALRSR